MSDPTAHRAQLTALAAELGRLGRRLDELSAELRSLCAEVTTVGDLEVEAPESPPAEPRAASAGWVGPPYPGPPYPASPWGSPAPHPVQVPADAPGSGPRRPWRSRLPALSGAKVLAWTGAGVTLLGVVLLLVLAVSQGWFAPAGRVIGGAVLGLTLLCLAGWLHRRETSRPGATALAGTGVATLYLVVAAATALYDFLPDSAGLAMALLVAGGGLGLADRWRTPLLASGSVVGAALLAPVVTDGMVPVLVALVLVLEVAAVVVALRHRWAWVAVSAAIWPVLYGMVMAASVSPADRTFATAVVVAVLVVRVVVAPLASTRLPRSSSAGLLASAALPTLVLAATVGGRGGAWLAAGAAAALAVVALVPRFDRVLRIAAGAAGTIAMYEASVIALDGATRITVLLGQSVVLVVVAAVLRSRVLLVIGGVYGSIQVLAAMAVQVSPRALVVFPAAPFVSVTSPDVDALIAAAGASALILAFAVAVLVVGARIGILGGAGLGAVQLWAPAGLVALYGSAGLVVASALLVSPDRTGFVVGHAAISVLWTVVALVLLARGINRPGLRLAGLVLVPVAVAKLILFDLVALDGIARVAAFLGAGLVLLAAGTRYARLVAEAQAERVAPPSDGVPGADTSG
ncbi:DUF2339 domain-containing protein [Pseudonocardia hispaniensis]|uniref:DUF2339 domain-containing protein n=1 Tax=Pseudonocardia hispaniensis TaxID=904933 RepID=A0ABW1J5E9_9PSEU